MYQQQPQDAAKILYATSSYSPEAYNMSLTAPTLPQSTAIQVASPNDVKVTQFDVGPNALSLVTRYFPLIAVFALGYFYLEHKKDKKK
jgi:hypothetical protein